MIDREPILIENLDTSKEEIHYQDKVIIGPDFRLKKARGEKAVVLEDYGNGEYKIGLLNPVFEWAPTHRVLRDDIIKQQPIEPRKQYKDPDD